MLLWGSAVPEDSTTSYWIESRGKAIVSDDTAFVSVMKLAQQAAEQQQCWISGHYCTWTSPLLSAWTRACMHPQNTWWQIWATVGGGVSGQSRGLRAEPQKHGWLVTMAEDGCAVLGILCFLKCLLCGLTCTSICAQSAACSPGSKSNANTLFLRMLVIPSWYLDKRTCCLLFSWQFSWYTHLHISHQITLTSEPQQWGLR